MKNPNQKRHVTAADAKRALHAMLAQDGLRFHVAAGRSARAQQY